MTSKITTVAVAKKEQDWRKSCVNFGFLGRCKRLAKSGLFGIFPKCAFSKDESWRCTNFIKKKEKEKEKGGGRE